MKSTLRRYNPKLLSILPSQVPSRSLSPQSAAVSGLLPWLHHDQKRQSHGGPFYSPKHRRPSRWWAGSRWPIATSSFRTTTTISSHGDNNTGASSVCQLFREIGDRIESADRDRKTTTHIIPSERKSAESLTSEFCECYLNLSLPDKHPSSWEDDPMKEFIELLLDKKYDVDEESILSAIDNAQSRPLRPADTIRIRGLCTPQYEKYFHYILGSAKQDLGVAFLVKLRRNIRDFVQKKVEVKQQNNERMGSSHQLTKLQALERNIQNILTSLFRPGVLKLERITYEETPASIIEQIAFKEAVHPLQSLQDLRTRLGPGRRCFAFFHPALPNKPLVFVHVALLKEIPTSMSDLQYATESDATCATFYSITNTEQGLAGVDLGNHLIKSVVQVLQNEFPTKLDQFCTLSPIPKFRKWLEGKLLRKQQLEQGSGENCLSLLQPPELQKLQDIFSSESSLLDLIETLKSPTWHNSSSGDGASTLVDQLQPVLMRLAAYYLTVETRHGRPLCPVAKFHIRNGAEMYRLNYMADASPKGMRNSCGMMINYRYALDEIEQNRIQYEINGDVMVRDGVKSWLNNENKIE
ncbi:hypothetical protein ACHAXR_009549 [Thalassiosira sp. AJA248-18]